MQPRITKSERERRKLAEMQEQARQYAGQVVKLPPGEARGHETEVDYERLRLLRQAPTPASDGRD